MSQYPAATEKAAIQERAQKAFLRRTEQSLETARGLINKSYLADMTHFDVLPASSLQKSVLNRAGDVRIFRVERLVQENKQSVLESITAAYTALGAAGYSVFLFVKISAASDRAFYTNSNCVQFSSFLFITLS